MDDRPFDNAWLFQAAEDILDECEQQPVTSSNKVYSRDDCVELPTRLLSRWIRDAGTTSGGVLDETKAAALISLLRSESDESSSNMHSRVSSVVLTRNAAIFLVASLMGQCVNVLPDNLGGVTVGVSAVMFSYLATLISFEKTDRVAPGNGRAVTEVLLLGEYSSAEIANRCSLSEEVVDAMVRQLPLVKPGRIQDPISTWKLRARHAANDTPWLSVVDHGAQKAIVDILRFGEFYPIEIAERCPSLGVETVAEEIRKLSRHRPKPIRPGSIDGTWRLMETPTKPT